MVQERVVNSSGVPIIALDRVDPVEYLKELPCPDKNCNGIALFLEGARFFRLQEDDPSLGPVDVGFEADAWQCTDCKLYLLTPEIVEAMEKY